MISVKVSVSTDKKITEELLNKFDNGLDDLADFILAKSQELCPVDEATLKKSGHTDKTTPFSKSVYYDAVHAAWIEFGTDPHSVSEEGREQITKWAMRVLQLKRKDAEHAADGIIWKIRHHGSKPRPFLRPAIDDGRANAAEIITNAIQR